MTIPACVILDDFPINGSYSAREQQFAFGFEPTVGGLFGRNWGAQGAAGFCPPEVVEGFADLIDEFGLKGKFTVLAVPAGLGRLDEKVRATPVGYIDHVLDIVRRRIAPRFDITPEVLTHTMAYDVKTAALLPHTETAWLSHLAATGRRDEILAYVGLAWQVLRNVGLTPTGITVGGLPDPSGIANGQPMTMGFHREAFMPSVLDIVRRHSPDAASTFLYTYGKATRQPYLSTGVPEPIVHTPDGCTAYELLNAIDDPLLAVFAGEGDPIAEADTMVSPDMKRGSFIECIESGKALVFTIHAQTINSLNTGLGLRMLREALRRLHQRYGKQIEWMTATEMCALSAQTNPHP